MQNSFTNERVTVNSNECLRESNRHASVTYNNIGKHLARIRHSIIPHQMLEDQLCYIKH